VNDARHRRGQHDNGQADQADLGPVEGQGHDQKHRNNGLHDQRRALRGCSLAILDPVVFLQNMACGLRHFGAVGKDLEPLHGQAGQHSDGKHGHADGRDTHEEFDELPSCHLADQQVLGLAHQRADAAQRGAHGPMHHQVAQEGAELFEVAPGLAADTGVVGMVVVVVETLAGCDLVVNRVQAGGYRDDHRGYRQRVEESGQDGGREAEHQRQEHLRADAYQDLGEDEQQQIFQEKDSGDHENQQQDHCKVGLRLEIDGFRMRHSQHHGLQREQAAGLQGVALQGHGQAEDELAHQHPAGNERPQTPEDDRVDEQETDDGHLVPARDRSKKVVQH
jgi:hypothetical protein